MRIKAKRTRLGSERSKRDTVSRSHVRLVHPPYNWANEAEERRYAEQEAKDDLWEAIQEEREARATRRHELADDYYDALGEGAER